MFQKKSETCFGRAATVISGIGELRLRDTLECGQAFRFELVEDRGGYTEYIVTAYGRVINVGQRVPGELIFYGEWNDGYEKAAVTYFALDTDFDGLRQDVAAHTDSEWLKAAAESGKGIVILKQEPWEALLSFIISQNNNIPRIKKIIKSISASYGENLAQKCGFELCPISKEPLCQKKCRECGACYSFPAPGDVLSNPEALLPSRPGFRYKYMLDAARMVNSGEVDLEKITDAESYEYTLTELKKILGVGDKVASCVALFGFANYDAFPVDVWMKRAIDEYFDGKLDPKTLGSNAGIAQQYIFHYIRTLSQKK